MDDLIVPKRVPAGATISIIAPSGPVPRENFEKGVAALEAAGFTTRFRPDIFSSEGYLAGGDDRRLDELNQAFLDPGTAAVICARGGYGAMRLLDRIDAGAIARARKPLIGFSDITALELSLAARAGLVSFHGPLVTTLWREIEISRRHLVEIVTGRTAQVKIHGPGAETLRGGRAEGRLYGGNLSIISALMGTGHLPDLAGAVLFLEDTNEEPYRIDRLLMHLELAGVLGKAAGVVFGQLGDDRDALRPIAAAAAARLACPVVYNFPIGHGALNMALPQGVRAALDAGERSVTLLGRCVE
jgi:muramoyltetrapeptide carboxypeptidase